MQSNFLNYEVPCVPSEEALNTQDFSAFTNVPQHQKPGSVVKALDTRTKGPRFNAQLMRYQVTALGKLFTPTCLCRCKYLVVSVDS